MNMYNKDHLVDSEMEIWTNLCLLMDAAIMVDEEEQRRLLAEKGEESKCRKTLSKEEEEKSKKRFFYLFPRELRSSLVKKRYTQQNLNGDSTSSSSSVLDLKQIPQNPNSEPMVYDEEQRAKKGKSKIVYEDDDDDDDDDDEESEKRLFEKKFVTRRYTQQNYVNLNGASTSSLGCFEPSLLLYYNTAESEKTETLDPPNPNYQSSSPSSCLTENTSRKRLALPQRSKGGFKKAKVAPFLREARETPKWVFQVMRDMNGDSDAEEDPRLIFERTLSASDVNSNLSRLLIPFKKLIKNDFLTPAESLAIEKVEVNNKEEEENIGVGTILVNRRSEKWGLRFKIWVMEKKESVNNGTLNYILNWGWNDVVKGNNLKKDDKISLWTFRCHGVLCFALETE